MTIETDLTALATIYAKFDKEKKVYVSQLNKSALLRLDADFMKMIDSHLLKDGPEKENIEKNYRKISRYFHPDRKLSFLPEVHWLVQNLGQKGEDGICFKTLHTRYERLTNPQKYKDISFNDIKSRADCRQWLEKLRSEAGSYSGRSFCDSLIGLLDESGDFFDEVGKIKPKGLRALITFMPMIFAGYGAILFVEQLFAAYTLYFIMLKGGQYLAGSDEDEKKEIGKMLQDISIITATTTTTLLVGLLQMTFWASHQFYVASLQIGSSLLTPLITPSTEKRDRSKNAATESGGMQFKTPELKVISALLEETCGRLSSQFLVGWRVGELKRVAVEEFLFRMRVLDGKDDLAVVEKLSQAKAELRKLKQKEGVYIVGGETAKAIDITEEVINLLIEDASEKAGNSNNQLVLTPTIKKETSKNTAQMKFKTPELKVISAPLEERKSLLSNQFFGGARAGEVKRIAVEDFLFRIRVLDGKDDLPADEKLIQAQAELMKLKQKEGVYVVGKETAKAIDSTEQVINLLVKNAASAKMITSPEEAHHSNMQLVLYK